MYCLDHPGDKLLVRLVFNSGKKKIMFASYILMVLALFMLYTRVLDCHSNR